MGVATTLRSGGGVDTSDATASAEYILVGYTGYVNDQLIVGTMPDHGAVDIQLNCGESYTIPKGYHNGKGKVTVRSLADQTQATATAEYILAGKTCWVNGVKITGTMPNCGAISYSLPVNGTYTIPKGYHNGNGKVTQSIPTYAADGSKTIMPGTKDQLVVPGGTYVVNTVWIAGDANLKAENIKKDVTIFGVTGTYQGF